MAGLVFGRIYRGDSHFSRNFPQIRGGSLQPQTRHLHRASPRSGCVGIETAGMDESFISKLVKPDKPELLVSMGDLLSMAAIGVESGTVDIDEANVIQNMLNLHSKTVVQAMTHRGMVCALPGTMPIEEAHVHVDAMAHSRLLIYRNSLDDILGIVYRREMFSAAADDLHKLCLQDLVHPVDFIRDITPLDKALKLFLEHNRAQRIFMVVDEHGGTDGIIALEDLFEEILGQEIDDESTDVSQKKVVTQRRREKIMSQILGTSGKGD